MPVTNTSSWKQRVAVGVLALAPLLAKASGADALPPVDLSDALVQPAAVAEFELSDHSGKTFDRARLQEGWHLMMFGFTHCPDVCPMHLTFLDRAWDRLEEAGYAPDAMPRVVMVSVDPKRDSLERLKAYVTHFNAQFIGVTGEPAQIEALEDSLGAGHRTFSEDAQGNYDVMHTSAIYVINPEAKAVARLRPPFQAARLASTYHAIRGGQVQ